MLIDGLEWCELPVKFCDVFTLIFTAEDPLVNKNISPNLFWESNKHILDGLRLNYYFNLLI